MCKFKKTHENITIERRVTNNEKFMTMTVIFLFLFYIAVFL